jgi:hypothetical protein
MQAAAVSVSNKDLAEPVVANKPYYLLNPFSIKFVKDIVKQQYW